MAQEATAWELWGKVLQEGNFAEGEVWFQVSPGLGLQQSAAGAGSGAGRGGPCAQLVGVIDIFAVEGIQVVAKAERGLLVTLAGLLLAGGPAGWMGQGNQGLWMVMDGGSGLPLSDTSGAAPGCLRVHALDPTTLY